MLRNCVQNNAENHFLFGEILLNDDLMQLHFFVFLEQVDPRLL
jgi:hypothetical protein